jgi:hypothetical protein
MMAEGDLDQDGLIDFDEFSSLMKDFNADDHNGTGSLWGKIVNGSAIDGGFDAMDNMLAPMHQQVFRHTPYTVVIVQGNVGFGTNTVVVKYASGFQRIVGVMLTCVLVGFWEICLFTMLVPPFMAFIGNPFDGSVLSDAQQQPDMKVLSLIVLFGFFGLFLPSILYLKLMLADSTDLFLRTMEFHVVDAHHHPGTLYTLSCTRSYTLS